MKALHSSRPNLMAPNILKARILGPKTRKICGLSRAAPVTVEGLEVDNAQFPSGWLLSDLYSPLSLPWTQ